MPAPAIAARGIGKKFLVASTINRSDTLAGTAARGLKRMVSRRRNGAEEFWALRDISFELHRGEALGIIGRNGSGKSTLLKILSRITPPTTGEADIAGRVGSLLEIGTGFHQELTGRENTFLSGTILGMKAREISARFDEIVDFSGVEKFIDTPVKHYSSGMYLRLAFAVAAYLKTEILLIDEVLAVGDAAFQKKCIDKMSEVANEGRTVLFVSHNLGAVSRLCHRGLLLDDGKVISKGSISDVVSTYGRMVAARDGETTVAPTESVVVSGLNVAPADIPLESSTPLTIICRIEVKQVYWSLSLQLIITSAEGLNMVLSTIDTDRLPELKNPGCYEVEIVLPALWLRPGIYSSRIKALAHPEKGSTERFYSDWLGLPIEGGNRLESYSDRILTPRTEWHVQTIN